MSFLKRRTTTSVLALLFVFAVLPLCSASKKVTGQLVDSGTFGIYVNGKRVATEKFEIVQSPELSVLKAELKIDNAKNPQKVELQLLPNGNLQRYEWSEKDRGSAVVQPKDEFLVENINLVEPAKSTEQPFILPASTLILDDYFFSQRQILLWRYLASQCQLKPGEKGCELKPAQFGVIVPRQQTSMQVSVTYAGQQKVSLKGTDHNLSRFEVQTEVNNWVIWLDHAYKIQKIAIEAEGTEVYRD